MTFVGFLLFFDPPKPDAQKAIADLKNLGVTLKVITGDNRRVALHVAQDDRDAGDGRSDRRRAERDAR